MTSRPRCKETQNGTYQWQAKMPHMLGNFLSCWRVGRDLMELGLFLFWLLGPACFLTFDFFWTVFLAWFPCTGKPIVLEQVRGGSCRLYTYRRSAHKETINNQGGTRDFGFGGSRLGLRLSRAVWLAGTGLARGTTQKRKQNDGHELFDS